MPALAICFLLSGTGLFADEPAERTNALAKPPRESARRLQSAREAAAKGRFADALADLRAILDPATGDGFIPTDAPYGPRRTIKAAALKLLEALPAESRRLYELQPSVEAAQFLEQAFRDNDRPALADFARKNFPSRAAGEAIVLLANDALDRGDISDALAWSRLLDASASLAEKHKLETAILKANCFLFRNDPRRARDALETLASIDPPVTFRLGSRKHTTAEKADRLLMSLGETGKKTENAKPPMQMTDWPMYRGDATRNAAGYWPAGHPELRWRSGTLDPVERQQFNLWKKRNPEQMLFTRQQLLVAGNLVLTRSPRRLMAFDLSSGKMAWEYPPEKRDAEGNKPQNVFSLFQQIFWEDAVFGQLSSDGRHVFLVDVMPDQDYGADLVGIVGVQGGMMIARPVPAQPFNRLVALKLGENGKPAWSVGGEDGGSEPKLAGYFFLGPPLPHKESLYVLAEMDGTVRLCAIRAATGQLQWSIDLAQPDAEVFGDPVRRMAGASPSLADGILICPTTAGAVAAVDPLTRRLLWGFQYPVAKAPVSITPQGILREGGRTKHPTVNRSVADASPVLAAGRTLLLPVESDRLLCLDSTDGRLLWSCPREEMLYIAGVADEKIVLVGEGGIYAKSLQTGKSAWPGDRLELPGKALPSGRGILAGNFYCFPLSTRELVFVDLRAGKIASRIPSKAELGNITAAGNTFFSQPGDSIQAFSFIEEKRAEK
jgi:outer membrane protein assembly factor BamB